jgi:alpha-1,3-glucosyltransferase
MLSSYSSSIAIISALLLLRILVSFQPHSGQDNYHGKHNAYGGDYEAQRHWMELTVHLPIGDWYYYDWEYWGLDYPPLTAYISWICGVLSERLVGPQSVALYESRGYEDPIHKAYMRATVLVLDAFVYLSIVWIATKESHHRRHDFKSATTFILALIQPSMIVIDHGHFQYNSVSLGLALWGFYFMTKKEFSNCILGSIFFCLALNFKQMILYYAPAVFAYLLGRCLADPSKALPRFFYLGGTVIVTFLFLWWPFIYYGPTHADIAPSDRIVNIIRRLFPFQRGLFEGKVSNLWCALSVKPISIRERIPLRLQPIAATATTLFLILPACYRLFCVGRQSKSQRPQDWKLLLWGSANTGLAFFLASYQVHEKSILMALAPLSLLLWEDVNFILWFSFVATWSLWPLIRVDRLEAAYWCSIVVFANVAFLLLNSWHNSRSIFSRFTVTTYFPHASLLTMLLLHFAEAFHSPPPSLPDLFPVIWSLLGCVLFFVSWLTTNWYLFATESSKNKMQ